jgi:CHASE3 domain sensor protein
MTPGGDELQFDWRRGGAAAGALVATLILLAMVVLVAMSNQARDRALDGERHAYDVNLLTRAVDASIARSEAALGRFVLDEEVRTSGNIYYSQWRLAGQQINQLERLVRSDPQQRQRVHELKALYDKRGEEFALAARATVAKRGSGGTGYFYQAAQAKTGQDLTAKLSEIAQAERALLRERMEQTKFFSAEADRLTDYLSWLGVIVGLGAIFLGMVAVQAIRQFAYAKRLADSEAERAEVLELAVAERTSELQEAYDALRAEAEERQAAEAQLRQVQ